MTSTPVRAAVRPDTAIRVLLADAHPVVRRVLVELLTQEGDIRVVAECETGDDLVASAAATEPDVVLVDPELPGADPLEAARRVLTASPGTRVLVHARCFSLVTAHRARRLGVVGYLLKGDDLGDLPQRVREAAAGASAWTGAQIAP